MTTVPTTGRPKAARCRTAALLAVVAVAVTACGKTTAPVGSASPPTGATITVPASGSPGTTVTTAPAGSASGSSPESTTVAGAGVTRASFDTAGNAICKHYNTLNDALPQPPQAVAGQATTQAQLLQLATYVDSSEKLEDEETKALRALPHPGADSAAFTKVLDMQASAVALEAKIVTELRAGDTTDALTGITTIAGDGTAVNAPFDALGLVTCGSGAN